MQVHNRGKLRLEKFESLGLGTLFLARFKSGTFMCVKARMTEASSDDATIKLCSTGEPVQQPFDADKVRPDRLVAPILEATLVPMLSRARCEERNAEPRPGLLVIGGDGMCFLTFRSGPIPCWLDLASGLASLSAPSGDALVMDHWRIEVPVLNQQRVLLTVPALSIATVKSSTSP
jgi:hypothetical protein